MNEQKNNGYFSPIELISNRRLIAYGLILFGISGWIACGINSYLIVQKMKQDVVVQTIDSGSNIWLGAGLAFEKAKDMHRFCAAQAIDAGFNWNPNGFDSPEKVKLVFRGNATRYLDDMWKKSQDEFQRKQLHQKVEILDIKTVAGGSIKDRAGKSHDVVKALCTVQLVREGVDQGVVFADEPQVIQVILVMLRNPSVGNNGLMPLVVQNIDVKVQ